MSVLFPLIAAVAPAQTAESHGHGLKIHLDPATTEIHWKVSGVLHTVHGEFKLKNGEFLVNPETGLAEGEILVDATSQQAGNSRDRQMIEQVLESNRYPGLILHPDHFKGGFPAGQNSIDTLLEGTFNIHGQDHPIQMAVKIQRNADSIVATTQFSVPYVEWGMKNPSTLLHRVSKQVDVQVTAKGSIQQVELGAKK